MCPERIPIPEVHIRLAAPIQRSPENPNKHEIRANTSEFFMQYHGKSWIAITTQPIVNADKLLSYIIYSE